MKLKTRVQSFIAAKMKRMYAKHAIKRKRNSMLDWTDFEKNFISIMRRTVLNKDTILQYSWDSACRIAHDEANQLTIIVKDQSVQIHDRSNSMQFNTPLALQAYVNKMFDSATSKRCIALEEMADKMMINSLKSIQFGIDQMTIDMSHNRRSIQNYSVRRFRHKEKS